jgi:hypothetical protein
VLLIGRVNIAGLLRARGALARRKSRRAWLGGGRAIVRQLLAENVAALCGGIVGRTRLSSLQILRARRRFGGQAFDSTPRSRITALASLGTSVPFASSRRFRQAAWTCAPR